jgi:magnesium transporter
MDPSVITATTDMDQEDAARIMVRYDLAAMPVVDDSNVVWGIITYDDLMDVLEDEATEDIYRLANVPDRDLTVDSPIGISVRRRIPWLYLSGLTALFASWVISQFEATIAQVALLAAFQSVVAGLGGNTATQTLAIIVRAIALGEIEFSETFRTLIKEAVVGMLQGIFVGAAAGFGVYLWTKQAYLGLILGLSLLGNMIIATIVRHTGTSSITCAQSRSCLGIHRFSHLYHRQRRICVVFGLSDYLLAIPDLRPR